MAAASPSAPIPPASSSAGVAAPLDAAALRKIIFAASLGTLFEWYDFYLYGSLAVFFGELFFPPGNETAHLLASLATFGAGFGVRPSAPSSLVTSATSLAANTRSSSPWRRWGSAPRSSACCRATRAGVSQPR